MTIDTSPAALRKLSDEYLGDYEDTKVMRDTLLAVAAEKEAQAEVEKALRRMLCVHTSQGVPYMDDGKAQCSAVLPVIDYMRDTPKQIQAKLFARDAAKLEQQHNSEPAPQHHPEQPREMAPPADVPLPEPLFLLHCGALYNGEQDDWDVEANSGRAVDALAREHPNETVWLHSSYDAHQYAEAYAKAAVAAEREMREALELIATPKRPDGTWNRDREACRQLAAEALGRYNEKQKGM